MGTPVSPDKQQAAFNPQKRVEYLVTVVSGKDLPGVDHHGTSCDPYVVLRCGNNTAQTSWVKKNLNPSYNQTFTFQSDSAQHHITFTVRNKSVIKDVIMGEGVFKLEMMGEEQIWEGDVQLFGYHVKSQTSCLKVKVERKNYKSMMGKLTRSISRVQDKAKTLMSDKTGNLARLAFVIAHNHMVSRHLEGSIDVQVTLGYFIVSLSAEICEAESESKGTIELVEDTNANVGPTQTKPTRNMQKKIETRIVDLLDTIETTSVKMTRDIALTVKAGIVIAPKMEMTVQIMIGVKTKVKTGTQITTAALASPEKPPSPAPDSEEDKELKDMIYKIATGTAE